MLKLKFIVVLLNDSISENEVGSATRGHGSGKVYGVDNLLTGMIKVAEKHVLGFD